jgi:HEAT repeat protein
MASQSLDLISHTDTIPHLIRAMQQRNNYVRRAAASALGQIQDEKAIPYLIQALQSHSQYIRRVATYNLIRLRTPRAIPKLLPLLRHRNIAVRTCTAQIIGRLAHVVQKRKHLKQAARALWWRLTDHDDVAKAVFYALNHVANRLSVLEVERRSEQQEAVSNR